MADPGCGGPWDWWILGVAEPGSCGPKPNIRLWYLQYLFKCAQSSALLCLRSYVCALMSAPLCLRSYVGALMSALFCRRSFVVRSIDGSPISPSILCVRSLCILIIRFRPDHYGMVYPGPLFNVGYHLLDLDRYYSVIPTF